MADYNAKVAPFINIIFYVTGRYGTQRPTHMHVGLDVATSTPQNLYSMFDGNVIEKGTSNARGNYVVVKSNSSNYAFLYQHMESPTPVNIGDTVQNGQFLGIEGTTGEVTGLHLHLEMQILNGRNWYFGNDISYYIDPATFMGIPNETGISVYYDGTPYNPEPPQPIPTTSKNWYKYKHKNINIFLK